LERRIGEDGMESLVLFDHDGGFPDDYMALALLLRIPKVKLLGVVITPGDCYTEAAQIASEKLVRLLAPEYCDQIPIGISDIFSPNPFPDAWRKTSYRFDKIIDKVFQNQPPMKTKTEHLAGIDLMKTALLTASQPVTILVTGPLSSVAKVVSEAPELASKINKIVWMGGALHVKGNVSQCDAPHHDESAEWNSYCDPQAVHTVWNAVNGSIPVVMCPLDVTQYVPVTHDFLDQIKSVSGSNNTPILELAWNAYSEVLEMYQVELWDVLTTIFLAHPEYFESEIIETEVDATGKSQGRIRAQKGGRKVQVLLKVNPQLIYHYIIQQWSS